MKRIAWAVLLFLALAKPVMADDYDRTVWRTVEVEPGVAVDFEVLHEYRMVELHADP